MLPQPADASLLWVKPNDLRSASVDRPRFGASCRSEQGALSSARASERIPLTALHPWSKSGADDSRLRGEVTGGSGSWRIPAGQAPLPATPASSSQSWTAAAPRALPLWVAKTGAPTSEPVRPKRPPESVKWPRRPVRAPSPTPAHDAGEPSMPTPPEGVRQPVDAPSPTPAHDAGEPSMPTPPKGVRQPVGAPSPTPALDAGEPSMPTPPEGVRQPVDAPSPTPAHDAGEPSMPTPPEDVRQPVCALSPMPPHEPVDVRRPTPPHQPLGLTRNPKPPPAPLPPSDPSPAFKDIPGTRPLLPIGIGPSSNSYVPEPPTSPSVPRTTVAPPAPAPTQELIRLEAERLLKTKVIPRLRQQYESDVAKLSSTLSNEFLRDMHALAAGQAAAARMPNLAPDQDPPELLLNLVRAMSGPQDMTNAMEVLRESHRKGWHPHPDMAIAIAGSSRRCPSSLSICC